MHSSSIISFLSTCALAFAAPYNNGQWSPDSNSAWGAAATIAASSTEQVWAATTAAPKASSAAGYAGGWEMSVTWPAGCESWANPCPAGAHVAGGTVAVSAASATGKVAASGAYENPFTIYTTMTDANGVITGMPSKATVPAGMSVVPSVAITTVKNITTLVTSTSKTATQTGFVTSTSSTLRPQFTGAANAHVISTAGALVAAAGAVIALL